MTKVWYCPNCGYEITSRGRCHSCRSKLVASALPELASGDDEDEVGYRVDTWNDRDRGRLIQRLNDRGILHRFEEDELVVGAEDEERVDDLVADMVATPDEDDDLDSDESESEEEPESDVEFEGGAAVEVVSSTEVSNAAEEAVKLLSDAAVRLGADPTDMQADGDVAEASTSVFLADGYPGCDDETWAAVGRVTRRLLAVLGAEEALEADIRSEASVLAKLLSPLVGGETSSGGVAAAGAKEQTVYEMAEWMPEQRAHLGVLLEGAGIAYEWDDDDLVVPSDRETDVEDLFALVGGVNDEGEDDDESRYQAVAELFAACSRLSADPSDEARSDAVLRWIGEVQGPPLLGMDEVDWFRIMTRAKALAAVIAGDDDIDQVHDEAVALHDLLRSVV